LVSSCEGMSRRYDALLSTEATQAIAY